MHIDRLQRIPEPIEQVIRQTKSDVASAEVRSAGGYSGRRSKACHIVQSRGVAYKIGAGEALRLKFLARFMSIIPITYATGPLRDYCTGLMLPGERKSVEPMAARTAPARTAAQHQSLLHFVANAA
jgi:DDE superfamily endonuclease